MRCRLKFRTKGIETGTLILLYWDVRCNDGILLLNNNGKYLPLVKIEKLKGILDIAVEFAQSNPEVMTMALCGSYARGEAKPDSDIDFSIIVKDKMKFKATEWVEKLNLKNLNERLEFFEDKEYGSVWSRHVFLESKIEIEFSFADISWADTENLDEGTKKVVTDGYKIIYDPQHILKKLVDKIRLKPK